MKSLRFLALALVTALGCTVVARAGNSVSEGGTVSTSGTISAIDLAKRQVTVKFDTGPEQVIAAGPEVKRLDELKVGDRINFAYSESIAMSLKKSSGKLTPPVLKTALDRETKDRPPAASLSDEVTAVVEVKAMDPSYPSITVVNHAGEIFTVKVADKGRLEGVRAGDHIEISYRQAFFVSVAPAPKK